MREAMGIPKEDMDAINRSFARTDSAQIISKNHIGSRVNAGRREINNQSFVLESFVGKILGQRKELHDVDGVQVVVGNKGQRWEDIPEELRSKVVWFENDFEN